MTKPPGNSNRALSAEFRTRVLGGKDQQASACRDLLFGMLANSVDDLADIEDEVNEMPAGANRIEVKLKLLDHKSRLARHARDLISLSVGNSEQDNLLDGEISVRDSTEAQEV